MSNRVPKGNILIYYYYIVKINEKNCNNYQWFLCDNIWIFNIVMKVCYDQDDYDEITHKKNCQYFFSYTVNILKIVKMQLCDGILNT